jgi:hypothetical protein
MGFNKDLKLICDWCQEEIGFDAPIYNYQGKFIEDFNTENMEQIIYCEDCRNNQLQFELSNMWVEV